LVVGAVLGAFALRAMIAAWPETIGPTSQATNLLTIVATFCGVVLGALAPLALPSRTSPLPGATGKPLHLGVPAIQLGLSLTVLTAAALLDREAGRLVTSGGPTSDVGELYQITAAPVPPAKRAAQYTALLQRLTDRRTFDSVSLMSPGALLGSGIVDLVTTDCGNCTQGGISLPLQPVMATHYLVSADTFRTMGLVVSAGRGITTGDGWRAPRVAVLSRSLAMHHFQNGKAVGRRILVGGERSDWYRVVGVVEDQRPVGFGAGLQPSDAVYLSVLQLWVRSLLLELGVHRAMGARRTHILRFVLARAAGVALVGVAIGWWASLVVWGTLASVAAGLPPWDPAAAVRFAPLLVGATLGGALLPAWRATHSTPISLLASGAG